MEYEILGWPPDGPQLRLDHERFSYAGKFVMTATGKAVARDPAETAFGGYSDTRADAVGAAGSARNARNAASGSDDAPIVAAVAFSPDRTDDDVCWLRYVTVRRDRRGEGIGPELCALVRDRALDRDVDRLRIAVNNPYAYEALHRTGFGFADETTGIAELVLEHPAPPDAGDRYLDGLDRFENRDLTDAEERFLEERRERGPPVPIEGSDGETDAAGGSDPGDRSRL